MVTNHRGINPGHNPLPKEFQLQFFIRPHYFFSVPVLLELFRMQQEKNGLKN